MSVTTCPHCQHDLDPTEDSLYCESCGGNIMRQPRHPRAVEVDEELRELARECEYTDGAGFPDENPEYGDTIEGLINYKNALEERVYRLEVDLADATAKAPERPGPADGFHRVTAITDCSAYVRETWEVDVPEDLREYDDVEGYVERAIFGGIDAPPSHFVGQDVDGEHDRTINRIDYEEE